MSKIGLIGGGNMGEAIIGAVGKKYPVSVHEKDAGRCDFLKQTYQTKIFDLKNLVVDSNILIVAVKPQDIEDVLKEISKVITPEKLVVSIAAGITTAYIEKTLGKNIKVVRTMPNLPAMIGQGMTGVSAGQYAKEPDVATVCRIFELLGKTLVVKEELMDAVTAVSGSGPAYVFLFIECLINAAQKLGLNAGMSKELVMTTFIGSLHLLQEKNLDPADMRIKVTSKGGTTEAALETFKQKNLESILTKGLQAAHKRAGELARR